MLDENEFKPFTLADFSVADAAAENAAGFSASKGGVVNEGGSGAEGIPDQLASFKPLTFKEEEVVPEGFETKTSNGMEEVKTDTEKIQLSEEFKNSEFFLENSLLTNAEDFAEAIRDGAKLHKAQLLKQIEEQANDTDLIRQKTVAENQAAEEQRKKLLTDTENKVQEIKNQAYNEGFEAGRLQGMQKRYDEAEPLTKQVQSVLEQLSSLRKVVRFQAEEELVKLSLQIAKNVVADELKLNQDVIKNIVQVALHETEVQGKIYLYLHPDDYEFLLKCKTNLEQYLSEEQALVLRQNPDMKPGSINVESDEEIISRSIEDQYDLIEENLNEQIEDRHAHLAEVDIDAHDFNLPPEQDIDAAKKDSSVSEIGQTLDKSLIQEQTEQQTTRDDLSAANKTDEVSQSAVPEDAIKKEDAEFHEETVKPEVEAEQVKIKEPNAVIESEETSHLEQTTQPDEMLDAEQNAEPAEITDQEQNAEAADAVETVPGTDTEESPES